jgi:hypothetical protein
LLIVIERKRFRKTGKKADFMKMGEWRFRRYLMDTSAVVGVVSINLTKLSYINQYTSRASVNQKERHSELAIYNYVRFESLSARLQPQRA